MKKIKLSFNSYLNYIKVDEVRVIYKEIDSEVNLPRLLNTPPTVEEKEARLLFQHGGSLRHLRGG